MAASELKVNLFALASTIDSMESEQTALQNQIRAMYDSISELNGMWTGTASNAFRARAAEDYEKLNEMLDAMKQILIEYRQAEQKYRNCEQEVAAAIAAIQV